MRNSFAALLFATIAFQLSAQIPPKLKGLPGTWIYTKGMQGYEVWERQGDTLIGNGYLVKQGDTTHYETLKIYRAQKKWVLAIQLIESTKHNPLLFHTPNRKSLFFSHPTHDFPRAISFSTVKRKTRIARVTLYHPHESALPFEVVLERP
jgi:hypothetical protein